MAEPIADARGVGVTGLGTTTGGAAAVSTGMPGSLEGDEEKVVMIDSRGRLMTITRLPHRVLPLD